MSLLWTINSGLRPSLFRLRPPYSFSHHAIVLPLRHAVVQRSKHDDSREQHRATKVQREANKNPKTYFQEKDATKPPVLTEAQSTNEGHGSGRFPPVRVRYLRPAIWAVAASSGIYACLAYLEAKKQLQMEPRSTQARAPVRLREDSGPQEVLSAHWNQLDPISKLGSGIIGANMASYLGGMLVPSLWQHFWHTPARNVSYTLLTAVFVHSGAMHLGFNMYCGYTFLMPVGYSGLFKGDAYHLLSFYLGTGILSSFAQHASTLLARQSATVPAAFIPSGGASGAIFGILAAFCMQYPDAGLGILFLPFSIPAIYALPGVMAFDLAGVFGAFPKLHLGHAAHLSGAFIGVCYSLLHGRERLWDPLVEHYKKMHRQRRV